MLVFSRYSSLHLPIEDGQDLVSANKLILPLKIQTHVGMLHPYLFIQTIRNGCCGGFVDDAKNIQASNGAGIFGGLPLRVIKISWDCDYCIVNSLWRREGKIRSAKSYTVPFHVTLDEKMNRNLTIIAFIL